MSLFNHRPTIALNWAGFPYWAAFTALVYSGKEGCSSHAFTDRFNSRFGLF
jgi:hypothetical protein